MSEPTVTAAASIAALLAAGAAQCRPVKFDGHKPAFIVPDGYKVELLQFDELPPLPDHIRQQIQLDDLSSFAEYVKRYKSATTVLLFQGGKNGATVSAVFDYHRVRSDSAETGTASTQANRVSHRAMYPCPTSDEWKIWLGSNERPMKQEEFGRFIDENMPDIIKPDSAELLEMVLNFEAKMDATFSSKIIRQSGAVSLNYNETIDAGGNVGANTSPGKMKVPDEIGINVPIFDDGKKYDIKARIYFTVNSGKLLIRYELYRVHEVIKSAVKDVIADITAATEIAPMRGSI